MDSIMSFEELRSLPARIWKGNKRLAPGDYETVRNTEPLFEKSEPHIDSESGNSTGNKLAWALCLSTKITLVASYISLVIYAIESETSKSCILGNEAIYDDPPIVYEDIRFQREGFHDGRHNDLTSYEGYPNEENNAVWDLLLEVGVVGISKQENSRLLNGTATARKDQKQYVVELELFHQLHCLKWIRDVFWELAEGANTSSIVGAYQWQDHTDHCIDFIRQTIMCHGDITPITFEWIDELGSYIAHHTTRHQCRDFDTIYQWAKRRDTTGMHADGKHKNVEFSQQEKVD